MSVQLNLNSFRQTVLPAQLDYTSNANPQVLRCRFNPSSAVSAGYIVAGQPVKLVDLGASDSEQNLPIVDVTTADADYAFGVVIFATKEGQFKPGDVVEVALVGAVMWMYAKTTMNRGTIVSLDHTTAAQVIVPVTGDYIGGQLIDKAVTAGDLVRVQLLCTGNKYSGVST